MRNLLPYLIVGVTSGSLYGLAGVGLVLSYRTSGVFNFAHGAVAAAAAYIFYDLHVTHGVAWPLAALIAVLLFGAIAGLVMEQITRRLVGAPEAVVIVASLGLLLAIDGFLFVQFGSASKAFPDFLPTSGITLSGVQVSYAKMISIAIGAISVAGLYTFLRVSRLGVAMRAVVDDPQLLGLTGMPPVRVRTVAWMVGSMFAAMSGILLAPTLGLDALLLTMLVVQAFGATAVGRFSNLPLTYAGGLGIGIAASLATKYVSDKPSLSGLPISVPFLVLVVVLLVVPVRKLPSSKLALRGFVSRRRALPRPVQAPMLLAGGAALVLLPHIVGSKLPVWIGTMIMVTILASLSLLVWTSGQISLCQISFAAFGATTLSRLTNETGLPWGVALLLTGVLTIPLGAIVAIPAIRLSGLYLALTTFGFAVVMQNVVYGSELMFGRTVHATVERPRFWFLDARDDVQFYYVALAVAVATCLTLALVNRSRLGRLLRALAESPTMLVTNGLNTNTLRLIVFCISAFFSGLAGGLMVTQTSALTADTFQPFYSLLWLAVLATCGTRLLGSAVLAAGLLTLAPAYVSGFSAEQQTLAFGLAAVLASIVVANTARLSNLFRRLAAEAEGQRRRSPVGARRETMSDVVVSRS